MLSKAIARVARCLPPQVAHDVALQLLALTSRSEYLCRTLEEFTAVEDPVNFLGMRFRNPLGVAAGLDKGGVAIPALAALGFGHIEVGSVTLNPNPGKPQKVFKRVGRSQSLVNDLGVPSEGLKTVLERVKHARTLTRDCRIGLNLVSPSGSSSEIATMYKMAAKHVDYTVVNLSCPNIQDRKASDLQVLREVLQIRPRPTPLLVKMSPDHDLHQLPELALKLKAWGVDGFVATNTTTHHPYGRGGLSGRRLLKRSSLTVQILHQATGLPVIGVGGVCDYKSYHHKRISGASLVQVYSAMVFDGPMIVQHVLNGRSRNGCVIT